MSVRTLALARALALALCAAALPASAAEYPDHAIKMIVPFAAGGGTDVLARIVAQNLNSKWGQPVVVENQPGASGAIGNQPSNHFPARWRLAGRLPPIQRGGPPGRYGVGARTPRVTGQRPSQSTG